MLKKVIFCLTFLFIAVLAAIPVAQSQTLSIAPSNQTTYDNWEPTDGGTLTFTVTVGGLTAANISAGQIRFDFETVSNWKGTCMNEGSSTDTRNDLYFDSCDHGLDTVPRWQQPSDSTKCIPLNEVIAEWNSNDNLNNFSIDVTVSCRDYGAFGILRVKLYNHTSSSSGVFVNEVTITVPKDDNGNYIADKSDAEYGYTNPALDSETGPDTGSGVEENNNPGDGLVQFEEYRGFKINGVHKRLSPTSKDVFIHSPTDLGIGNGSKLRSVGFKVHEILQNETESMQSNRTVNYNSLGTPTQFGAGSSWNVQDTKALWIIKIDGSSNLLGGATRTRGTSRNPVNVYKIEIYPDQISTYASNLRSTTNINAATNADATALQLSRTIGHEIGHGVGLPHPWDASLPTGSSSGTQGAGWYGFADTSEKVTNTVSALIRTEAIARSKGQTPATNFLDTSGSSWTIRLNSYVANRSLAEPLGRYTFEAGSSIMDYNVKLSTALVNSKLKMTNPAETFTQAVGPGIFRSSTYHQLHNWEYQLLGDNVTPQTNPTWTQRTVSTNTTAGGNTVNNEPGDPENVSLSWGNGELTVSWDAPTNTGSSGVTDYKYRYSSQQDANGNWENWTNWESAGSDDTEVIITGLINGILYAFQVRTESGTFYSSGTDVATEKPSDEPDAPTNLTATGYDGWVSLSWTAPNDNGAAIEDYDYQYTGSNGSSVSWTSTGDTSSSEPIRGLTNGILYTFEVRAENRDGEGPASSSASATPKGRPSAPQNLETTAGDGEVTLTWETPLTNNGSAITGYKYSYYAGTSGTFNSWTSVGNVLTATVSGLTNDTLYQFAVLATNSVGDGSYTGPVDGTPESSVTTPGPPKDLTVVLAQNGIVVFSWSAPDDNGGADVTGYKYQYREKDTTTWSDWTNTAYTSGYYIGLTNGTTYEIQVLAVNSEGSGTLSDILEVTPVIVPVRPGAPQNLSATAGDGQVTLEWDEPDFDGHSDIIGYQYRYDTNNDGSWGAWTDTENGTTTSVTITGLTNGTEYAFQVRAENDIGTGGASSSVTATPQGTTATVPTAPRNLSASPHSSNVGWATLTWDAPNSDGGEAITHYEWRYCTRRSNGPWSSWSSYRIRNSTATSMNLRNLTSGVLYGFQVRAVNSVGSGPGSNTTSTRGKE